jgi:hypothetical protein
VGYISVFANDWAPKHTREKTIRKEFKVTSEALLKIQNSYGNLVLNSWNEDKVVIEVHITTQGNNPDKVARKLESISVAFEATENLVSAKTQFENNKSWNWWGGNNAIQMQVNYTIKLPVKNSVYLSNDYGGITLDRIDGHAKINCDYGRLDLGELRGRNNELRFDYTSKSRIGYMNSGNIKADYSGFILEKAGALTLSADYTNSEIGSLESLEYSCDYGNLEVDEVKHLHGRGDYLSVKFNRIAEMANIQSNYGGIRIGGFDNEAQDITLETEYTGIKIGYTSANHFDFEIDTEYTGVKGKDALQIQVSKESNQSKFYSGYFGAPKQGPLFKIKSSYGNIAFEKK